MFSKLKQKMNNKRVNKLAMMKHKTKALREKRTQYLAEAKIERDYRREKKAAFDRSAVGKIKGFAKKQLLKKHRKNGSSGLFADEANNYKKKVKRSSKKDSDLFSDNDDVFKKWGL